MPKTDRKKGVINKTPNTCKQCGTIFHTFPSRKRAFCNRECYEKSRGGKSQFTCTQCRQPFKVYTSDIESNRREIDYCSRECLDASGRVEQQCPHCKKLFSTHKSRRASGKDKYCSMECRMADNPAMGGSVERTCKTCNTPFRVHPYTVERGGGVFCSKTCSKTADNNPQWIAGHTIEYPTEWNRKLRRKIRKRDQHACQLCGERGKDVHHIDYDKQNCSPQNLITLCHPCHSKTNTNRDEWMKKFQEAMSCRDIG